MRMDEILIEEKKYVSSKQASKVTGYAKDYIGQLCREGRVPARLVGRSWYVLESAIHDHRFGNPEEQPVSTAESATSSLQSTWESPRYETTGGEVLPSVSRIRVSNEPLEPVDVQSSSSDAAQRLQETWQAWFDRFDTSPLTGTDTAEAVAEESEVEPEITEEKEQEQEQEEVSIPIRAVHHALYQPPPEDFLPRHVDLEAEIITSSEELPAQEVQIKKSRGRGAKLRMMLQVAGAVVAVITISLATLGSGYLDRYIISNEQVGLIAGVGFYNK